MLDDRQHRKASDAHVRVLVVALFLALGKPRLGKNVTQAYVFEGVGKFDKKRRKRGDPLLGDRDRRPRRKPPQAQQTLIDRHPLTVPLIYFLLSLIDFSLSAGGLFEVGFRWRGEGFELRKGISGCLAA